MRWGWRGTLALLLFARPVYAEIQFPSPLDCVNSQFQQQVRVFENINPVEQCKLNGPAKCDEGPENLMVPGKGRSLCQNMYWRIKDAAKKYSEEYRQRCNASNVKLTECKGKPTPPAQIGCLKEHHIQIDKDENEIAKLLMDTQGVLIELEKLADEARKKYQNLKQARASKGIGPTPPSAGECPFLEDTAIDQTCTGRLARNRCGNELFLPRPGVPDSQGPIIDEQTHAMTRSLQFRQIAFTTAERHQKRGQEFAGRSRQLADLERRFQTAGPTDGKKAPEAKSDITGTDKPPQQQAGGPQGGGGGSQGGGGSPSGSGPASGFDQGGGSNAGTPPSFNNAGTTRSEPPADKANKVGKDSNSGTGSTTAERIDPTPSSSFSNNLGSGVGDSGIGASRGLASSGKGRGSTAASSSSPGGGGVGGSGGGSSVPCLGKDCQQALSATGGQFSSAGSLGGGGGGGGMDDSGALDSLFKNDEPGGDAGPGGDALAALEGEGGESAGFDDSTAGGEMQAGGAGEIGSADGGDLFHRVRGMYTKAQKKGLVAGMLKKL